MNIAVINFSGNVGKSTISRHLFFPRMGDCVLIPVESINADDNDKDEMIRGRAFNELMEKMLLNESSIVDVGASNVEEFIAQLADHAESHEDFDYFIIPTVGSNKQVEDTWSTIDELNMLGIPKEKIKLVFNKMDRYSTVDDVFGDLINRNKRKEICTIDQDIFIRENELFTRIGETGKTILEMVESSIDYKAMIKEAESKEEKVALIHELGLVRLAQGVVKQLDSVFDKLALKEGE